MQKKESFKTTAKKIIAILLAAMLLTPIFSISSRAEKKPASNAGSGVVKFVVTGRRSGNQMKPDKAYASIQVWQDGQYVFLVIDNWNDDWAKSQTNCNLVEQQNAKIKFESEPDVDVLRMLSGAQMAAAWGSGSSNPVTTWPHLNQGSTAMSSGVKRAYGYEIMATSNTTVSFTISITFQVGVRSGPNNGNWLPTDETYTNTASCTINVASIPGVNVTENFREKNGTNINTVLQSAKTTKVMQTISSTRSFSGKAPVIPGYTYVGYNTAGNSTVANTSDTYSNSNVTSAINIYYLYEKTPEKKYTISYDACGADGGEAPVDGGEYVEGKTATVFGAGNLEKDGYTFAGWNTKPDGSGDSYMPGDGFVASYNATLYAQWQPRDDIEYTVSYYLAGTAEKLANDKSETGQTMGDTVAEYAKSIAGYTADAESKQLTLAATGNELAFHYTPNEYQITYNLNDDESAPAANDPSNPTGYNVTDLPLSITDPNREGYIFAGWTSAALGIEDEPVKGCAIAAETIGDVDLAAHWILCEPEIYEIRYELNGGTNHPDNPASYTSEELPIFLQDPEKNGHDFAGWQEGNMISADCAGDMTFTAQWSIKQYTIHFDGNQGTVLPGNETRDADYNTSLGSDMPPNPTREGYAFVGWNTQKDGEGADFTESSSIADDMQLYAQWQEEIIIPSVYTVEVKDNYANMRFTGAGKYAAGETVVINAGKRSGYAFVGWTVNSGNAGLADSNAETTIFVMPENDVTVTANWLYSQPPTTLEEPESEPEPETEPMTEPEPTTEPTTEAVTEEETIEDYIEDLTDTLIDEPTELATETATELVTEAVTEDHKEEMPTETTIQNESTANKETTEISTISTTKKEIADEYEEYIEDLAGTPIDESTEPAREPAREAVIEYPKEEISTESAIAAETAAKEETELTTEEPATISNPKLTAMPKLPAAARPMSAIDMAAVVLPGNIELLDEDEVDLEWLENNAIPLNNGWFAVDLTENWWEIFDECAVALGLLKLTDDEDITDLEIEFIETNLIPLENVMKLDAIGIEIEDENIAELPKGNPQTGDPLYIAFGLLMLAAAGAAIAKKKAFR